MCLAILVPECQVRTLAPTVGVGGGGLCLLHRQAGGAQHQGGQDGHLGEHGEDLIGKTIM